MTKKKRITYIAGSQVEIKAYTAPNIPKNKLKIGHKGGHSTAAQQRYNDKKQKEKLVLKAENTYGNGSWMVTYTFDKDHIPDCAQTAAKKIKAAVRNTKKDFKSKKCECAYMGAVEIGSKGGLHIHMMYPFHSKKDMEIFKKYWPFGHVDVKFVPGIEDIGKGKTKKMDIKAVVLYVFKDPLVKIVGRSFKEPKQETFEISDAEFNALKDNPIIAENELPDYRTISTDRCDYMTWWGRYQRVKIRLAREQNDSLFTDAEVYNFIGYRAISKELLHKVDIDQRPMWSTYGRNMG